MFESFVLSPFLELSDLVEILVAGQECGNLQSLHGLSPQCTSSLGALDMSRFSKDRKRLFSCSFCVNIKFCGEREENGTRKIRKFSQKNPHQK